MARRQFSYVLSQEADNDLDGIYDYSAVQFGVEQTIKYLTGLGYLFEALCKNPELGRQRNELRKGLRSVSYMSHVVFYRILEKQIRIVRVLHASRDMINFLPTQD